MSNERNGRFDLDETFSLINGQDDNISLPDHDVVLNRNNRDRAEQLSVPVGNGTQSGQNGGPALSFSDVQMMIETNNRRLNMQIEQLTALVRTIADRNTNVRVEESALPREWTRQPHSDMVTGINPLNPLAPEPQHPQSSGSQQNDAYRLPQRHREIPDAFDNPPYNHHNDPLRFLNTDVPKFRGARDKYNEFEHLLTNHLRPYQHRVTEEQKLRFFQSLLREDAIEFYQSIRITTETTLTDVLHAFRREFAKEDQQEVARFKFNKLTYDPKNEQFPDFLKNLKKIGKQAFGDRSQELVEAMLFGKLPIQIQSQLTLAGKQNSSLDEIKQFITRQCQYEQFLAPMNAQPFSQATNPQPVANTEQQPEREAERPATRPKYKFTGECHYCGKIGHKAFECRTRKREERQQQNNEPEQPDAESKPKYNAKLVCQICGYTGHSAKTCKQRNQPASAYRQVPYERQTQNENKNFRREFKQSHKAQPINEMSVQTDDINSDESYDSDVSKN